MKQYDLIVSFGYGCGGTQSIRAAGLQYASFPFDWIFYGEDPTIAAHDMQRRTNALANGFKGCLLPSNMRLLASKDPHDIYEDLANGCIFSHDFIHDIPLKTMLPIVRDRYQRRTRRLYRCLKSAKNILIIRMDPHAYPVKTTPEDCIEARDILARRFPKKNFDILLFSFIKGMSYEARSERTIAPGIVQLAFDYSNHNPNSAPYNPDLILTSKILRERYSVRDYRTFQERLFHKWRQHLKRIKSRYGVDGEFKYRLLQVKRLFAC